VAAGFHKARVRFLSFTLAIVVATIGLLVFKFEAASSNVFFDVVVLFSLPGLTIAAVVGGAMGIGTIHGPSFVLAWIFNFAIYFFTFLFVLTKTLKPKA
jgi:hypothetical protein